MNYKNLIRQGVDAVKGNSRSSKVLKNILGSFVVRGLSILISLIIVPLTIGYVSSELYGIWLALATITSWVSLFDLGFGNGLRNKVAECVALEDWAKARRYISTAYFFFTIVFVPLSVLFYYLCGVVNWSSLLNISPDYQELLIVVMQIIIVSFCITMIAKILNSVLAALQMNALVGFVEFLGQVLVLIGTFVLTKTTQPSLIYLAWCICLCPIIVYLFSSIWLYFIGYRNLKPSGGLIEKGLIGDVFTLGYKFFIMQISVVIMYQTMNIIISRVAGPESVTEYNVVYKYVSIPLMAISMIVAPIWSAFTDAYTLKDYAWMQRAYSGLLKSFWACAAFIVVLVIAYPTVFRLWLGDKVDIHLSVVLTCAVFILILVWNNLHSALLNGLGKILLMLYTTLFVTVIDIPLAYFMGLLMGTVGVVLAVTVLNIPFMIIMRIQIKKIINKTANGIWER